ncbi:Dienelactone hydrolase family protein [Seminavis robusta]|uniref:Dienelactone hydrolase family protein n=1 Tax=Seminavis robusta TaxID=568900 RepID=A0A9N8DDN7_9STRA|nr:Dienelactone hydrolase family protein [Seminavis robusta]|eukprot:Sro75_g041180.1 Dienelactone hydrolase family protein (259) ;mRNA; r:55908-56684
MSSSSSPCCPPGSWEGPLNTHGPSNPKGVTFTFPNSDLKAYHIGPSDGKETTIGIIVFHDVWGLLPRLLSICDVLAEELHCHVIAPDSFRGKTKDDVTDMVAWMKSHPYEPEIAGDIKLCHDYLQIKHGITQWGALGFCWGGWAIAKSAAAGFPWKVAVSPHPSLVVESKVFGGSETEMVDKIQMPFLLLPAGNDPDSVKPGGEHVKTIEAKGGKSIPFEDMVHGWTTRSDLSDPKIKEQVEKALSLSLEFLKEHLKP